MSVIAWDGKTVAADKQATNNTMRHLATKLRRLKSGLVVGFTGDADSGAMMAKWYEDGADPEKYPACQRDKDDWSRLIVFAQGEVFCYERQPVAMPVEDAFMAWGSGREFAIGAMARGATAREAVEIAMRFDTGCGLGVDAFDL